MAHIAFGIRVALCCVLITSTSPASAVDDDEAFFETNVRPILVDRCVECHGAEKQSGGLRLDSAAGLMKGGDSGTALVRGNPTASRLIQAIRYDGDLQMPPENPLSDEQKSIFVEWVGRGAPWPATMPLKSATPGAAEKHWAFQPVVDYPIPKVAGNPSGNPIDAFLNQRLEEHGLTMSPEIDRRTLIRRVTFALTGLPPAPDEVAAFENDDRPDAWQRLTERLLNSPAYGEHWARHWLDVARYSDTKGYVYAREERFWVHAWTYRDWVIRALNEDMPYDRFLLLQIAGDQVPDCRDADLAAMGFMTIGRRFLGVRRDIVDDHIDVVCRGTMALTVGCARCHDHKYDPIPTSDYYSLYGVFDSSRETLVPLPARAEIDSKFVADYEAKRSAMEASRQEQRAITEARLRARTGDYLRAQLSLDKYPEAGFDQILAPADLLPSFVHRWRDDLRETERSGDPVFSAWHAFRKVPTAEFRTRAAELAAEWKVADATRVNPRISASLPNAPESFESIIKCYTTVFTQTDQKWQAAVKEARAAGRPDPAAFEDPADEQLRLVLYGTGRPCRVPDEPITSTEYDFDSPTCDKLWKEQVELERMILNAASQPAFAVILKDRATPVTARIFKRGNPANKGDDVPRQFLSVLSGSDRKPFQTGSGRLELAQAIIDPGNPLTARVIVNRVWAHYFGTGIVSSPGDFGVRAEPPSHPELLDWLASRLIAEGWSLKNLHRLIVSSSAFRQSSLASPDSARNQRAMMVDPANRLLWRMNPHRLSFEEMRDSMLRVSEQLETFPGGKPVDLFKAPYPRRRTVYGLVDRQFLPGTLRMFDFANPDLHIPQRSETTVPQQSLFLMNHPLVLDRVRQLAQKVTVAAGPNDPDQQIQTLYHLVYQRPATADQLRISRELMSAETPQPEPPPVTAADWSYGYGSYDEAAGKVSAFAPLPYFSGTAWQGGPSFPDAALGWVQLSASGGHPGNDRQHAAIRRWVAPRKMTVRLSSEVIHEPEAGDGIRVFVASSRSGELAASKVHKHTLPISVDRIDVDSGDTIDFVVDIGDVLNSDQYFWRCRLTEISAESETARVTWNSESDFPKDSVQRLTPLEQLAQVLLCSNEFLFVD